jgi:hypothetical protein
MDKIWSWFPCYVVAYTMGASSLWCVVRFLPRFRSFLAIALSPSSADATVHNEPGISYDCSPLVMLLRVSSPCKARPFVCNRYKLLNN